MSWLPYPGWVVYRGSLLFPALLLFSCGSSELAEVALPPGLGNADIDTRLLRDFWQAFIHNMDVSVDLVPRAVSLQVSGMVSLVAFGQLL